METVDLTGLLQALPSSAVVLLFVIYMILKQRKEKKNGIQPPICPLDKSEFVIKMSVMAEHQREVRDDTRNTNKLMERMVAAQDRHTQMLGKLCEKE